MKTEIEGRASHTPILRKAAAGAVLVIAAIIVIKIAIGLISAVFWTVIGAAVVLAILWALKTLFW